MIYKQSDIKTDARVHLTVVIQESQWYNWNIIEGGVKHLNISDTGCKTGIIEKTCKNEWNVH